MSIVDRPTNPSHVTSLLNLVTGCDTFFPISGYLYSTRGHFTEKVVTTSHRFKTRHTCSI